jgi:arginine deiminase
MTEHVETTESSATTEKGAGLKVFVDSEVGTLRRVMVHSPDSGLGKVVPSKAQDWLFEDIVHLDVMRREEYDYFTKLLLYFLDPDKIKHKIKDIDDTAAKREFYKPDSPDFYNSDKVVEIQQLLSHILQDTVIKTKLVASISAIERCSYATQEMLLELDPVSLSKTLISGSLPNGTMLFAPIPNLIFTRDIGIVVNDHILLNKPAKLARTRESLLAKYVFFNHELFHQYRDKVIELDEHEHHFLLPDGEKDYKNVTIEGGDVMMVAPNHLVVGISERTSPYAVNQVIKALFERNVVNKVTAVRIPKKRDYMHIDTIFTQVKRNVWVLLGSLSREGDKLETKDFMESLQETKVTDKLKIHQFIKGQESTPRTFEYLEDLLEEISMVDLKSPDKPVFVYSGDNEFPYGAREQWTDSCNLLAVKEGVAIGYDRNDKTSEAFRKAGFSIIKAADLLDKFESGELDPKTIENTLIMLPSAELSRARGGSHCMSMPLWRENIGTC